MKHFGAYLHSTPPDQAYIIKGALKVRVTGRKHIYITERITQLDIDLYERMFTIRTYRLTSLKNLQGSDMMIVKVYKDVALIYNAVHISESTLMATMTLLLNNDEFNKFWSNWNKTPQIT